MTTTSRSVREALAALPTASISDALDFLGLPGSLHGIGPLRDATRHRRSSLHGAVRAGQP